MKDVLQNSKIALFAGLLIIVICASAWQIHTDTTQTTKNGEQVCTDTTGPSTVYSDKIDLGVNVDSIMKAARTALSAVNFNKLQQLITLYELKFS